MPETTNQQPTATLTNGVFSCVVDGVEWRANIVGQWWNEKGDPSYAVLDATTRKQMNAAAYRAMGEAMHERPNHLDNPTETHTIASASEPTADELLDRGSAWASLTPEERAAVTGAIRDAERGVRACVFPVTCQWYEKYVHRQGIRDNLNWSGRTEPELLYSYVWWDTRTGQRTVLDVDAFREAVGVESEEWEAYINSIPKHTRPEPEETADAPDESELTELDNKLIESLEELDAFLKDGGVIKCVAYRRISPNPPRVRVEEDER